MDKRIALTETTQGRLKDFSEGAGMTYNAAISLLLDIVTEGESGRMVGSRLRYEIESGKREHPSDDDDKPSRHSLLKELAS